jgi:hypothetical protein
MGHISFQRVTVGGYRMVRGGKTIAEADTL